MQHVGDITVYLKQRLREAGAARFDAIAEATGVSGSFIRKFVYGSRENPRVRTIQPLLDYFAAQDAEVTHEAAPPRDGSPARHAAPSLAA